MSVPTYIRWLVVMHDGDESTFTCVTKKLALEYARERAYHYHCDFSLFPVDYKAGKYFKYKEGEG